MTQLLALCISALFITIAPADAQFLSRDFRDLWSNEVFENYGTAGYRDYDFNEENNDYLPHHKIATYVEIVDLINLIMAY